MTDQEIAKALLGFYGGNEARWTKDAWARDAGGNRRQPREDEAVCWCVGGAIRALDVPFRDLDRLEETHFHVFASWNDQPERTFAEVEAKLREIAGVTS